ncbi:MAG: NADH-quinone oxidoreductase subunit N [Gammaproteobacteria bacterium]|jgi:NADH-quinone oxidoreductase subunit N
MNGTDLLALSPVLAVAVTLVVVLLIAAFYRRHAAVMAVTQLGLVLALAALVPAAAQAPRAVTSLLIVDRYTLFFTGLILAATLATAALAYDYLARRSSSPEEFYILLLTACLGGLVLAASRHFASFFLGLELLSVALFALIAYPSERWRPLEAGIKYLILSGMASALLLFGMALVYAQAGTMQFDGIAAAMNGLAARHAGMLTGAALILTGLGFKLSLVPFHMWVADVYEGAPAPVGAYLATVSKGAVFALLLRYLDAVDLYRHAGLIWAVILIAVASMLIGNLLALLQNNLKRVLAYSSVAHLGYLLVAPVAGGNLAVETAGYYLAAYFVTLLGAFGVITLLSTGERDADTLTDYQGLFWRHPWLAGTLSLMLLSLAGIPVTMGFVAKFYVLAAGVDHAQWLLVYGLVIASAIGLFYYLRIIIVLFAPPEPAAQAATFAHARGGGLVVLATTLLLLILGIYPVPVIDLLHPTAAPIAPAVATAGAMP